MTAVLLIPWFRWQTIALRLGQHELTLHPYRIAMAVAIATIICTAALFARKRGRSVELTLGFIIHVMAFALPAALLASVVLDQPQALSRFVRRPENFADLRFYWSTFGGMIGGLFGALVWKLRTEGSLLEMLDVLAFALPFGWCIARLGCFAVHDHAGRVSHFALAVAGFHFGVPPYQPRHDMALYDAIVVGAIALLFLFLSRTPRKKAFYLALLLILYTPARFFLDFLRAPQDEGGMTRYLGLTHIQYIAIVLFAAGLVLVSRIRSRAA